MTFLPTSKKEMDALGWEQADIVLISGDAYIDHPSFGVAVIARVLEKAGYRVAIVAQPNWRDDLRDFRKLGSPRLFFGISSGCMDSMVNHYTANKRRRSDDAYSPGGQAGLRPDYAVSVYSNILKRLYPNVPLVIGGIEASLRRLTHYDYWSNSLKPSILIESQADLLVYGMGERPIVEIAQRLARGENIHRLRTIAQVAYWDTNLNKHLKSDKNLILNSFYECQHDKHKLADNFRQIEIETNRADARIMVEPYDQGCVVVNPPFPPASTSEVDSCYDLPFTRMPHPRYRGKRIPAWEMIKFSITIHRGCFGGCAFCSISAHQGHHIASRSEASILREVEAVKQMPGFKGYLSDIGGPSANMYGMGGRDPEVCQKCHRQSCLHPAICPNLQADHSKLNQLYAHIRALPGIKKAFVSSGIRYDLFVGRNTAPETDYFENLCRFHVSGRLKVAPEHTVDHVLQAMRKPSFELFKILKQKFQVINDKYGLNQQLIPYFISGHPACTEIDMQQLADETKRLNFRLEQVQDFTPTPMTLSTTIFYSGLNPYTGKRMYVARSQRDKQCQLKYFFWYKKPFNKQSQQKPNTKNKNK